MAKIRGFTLVEVMVAVFVLALTLTAALASASYNARALAHAQQIQFAYWAAENARIDLLLDESQALTDHTVSEFPVHLGTLDGHVRAQAHPVEEAPYFAVDIRVYAHKDDPPLAQLNGYYGVEN